MTTQNTHQGELMPTGKIVLVSTLPKRTATTQETCYLRTWGQWLEEAQKCGEAIQDRHKAFAKEVMVLQQELEKMRPTWNTVYTVLSGMNVCSVDINPVILDPNDRSNPILKDVVPKLTPDEARLVVLPSSYANWILNYDYASGYNYHLGYLSAVEISFMNGHFHENAKWIFPKRR